MSQQAQSAQSARYRSKKASCHQAAALPLEYSDEECYSLELCSLPFSYSTGSAFLHRLFQGQVPLCNMSLAVAYLSDARKHAHSCEYDDARVYFRSALNEVDRCAVWPSCQSESRCQDMLLLCTVRVAHLQHAHKRMCYSLR